MVCMWHISQVGSACSMYVAYISDWSSLWYACGIYLRFEQHVVYMWHISQVGAACSIHVAYISDWSSL